MNKKTGDEKLIKALRGKHYKSIEVLCYQSGLSPRTVRNTLTKLNADLLLETVWMRITLNSRPILGYRIRP